MMHFKALVYHSLLLLCIPVAMYSAMANYNNFPTHRPAHILDDMHTNLSFAFSMRVLESDYNGPLVRLRRASDNAEQDFGWADNDIVDVVAIDTWRAGSNVYVHTWYDQSGLGRDAVQLTTARQPQFFTNSTKPYFKGDGVNDYLEVNTPNGIQDLTNNGKEGTVLSIAIATKESQYSYGVASGGNRWSTHINWSNAYAYFDVGPTCCATGARRILNDVNYNNWAQYTFFRTSTHVVMRSNQITKLNAALNWSGCTLTNHFLILNASANDGLSATNSFMEMIMYKIDLNVSQYQVIENNAMTFWGL